MQKQLNFSLDVLFINRSQLSVKCFHGHQRKNWHNKTIELQSISCGRNTNEEEEEDECLLMDIFI